MRTRPPQNITVSSEEAYKPYGVLEHGPTGCLGSQGTDFGISGAVIGRAWVSKSGELAGSAGTGPSGLAAWIGMCRAER